MFNPRHLHIALASDNNYIEFVAIVIVSLFATNKKFEQITIHLLANDISVDNINKIKQHIPENGELIIYSINDISNRLKVKVSNTIAISAYARLFLSSFIPKDIDKILYVDCDVVFNNDITKLWEKNIAAYSIGGVLDTLPDYKAKELIGLKNNDAYVNSGVLLINLDYWRNNNIEQQFIDFLLYHNGEIHHHDQGIINAVCKNRLILKPKYNLTSTYLSHPYWLLEKTNTPFYTQDVVKDAIVKPAIIHFTEGFYNRPWISNSKHPMANVFRKYRNMTLWKNKPYRPDNRSIAVKTLSFFFLNTPYPCYNFISKIITILHKVIK